jgi:hypothetical protein
MVGGYCTPRIIEKCETGKPISLLMLFRIAEKLDHHIDFVEKTAIVS